jgi:hypothetical protein
MPETSATLLTLMSKEKERRHTPVAFQSPLWPYLEQIRSWRRARMTWREITERLNANPGPNVGLTLQAVHSFFATASKRAAPPLGFDSLPGQPPPQPATQPAPETASQPAAQTISKHALGQPKADKLKIQTFHPQSHD